MRFFLKLSIITLLIVSCSSDSNNEDVQMPEAEEEENNDTEFVDNFDRSTMITEWADKIIIPNYDLFVDKLNFYNNNTAIIFGENHTVTSNDISFLRITFENIYFNWQIVSLYDIGPAKDLNLKENLNSFPLDINKTEQNIVSGVYDLTLLENQYAKGFPSLDYLLNGISDSTNGTVDFYNDPSSDAYKTYFKDVLAEILILSNTTLTNWQSSYRDEFILRDGNLPSSSVNMMVNVFIRHLEVDIRVNRLGNPLGLCDVQIDPSKVEGTFRGGYLPRELFLANMLQVISFFNGIYYDENTPQGVNSVSLDDYLNHLIVENQNININPDTINARLNSIYSQIESLNVPFQEDLLNGQNSSMLMAFNSCNELLPILKTDMLDAFNIMLGYTYEDCN